MSFNLESLLLLGGLLFLFKILPAILSAFGTASSSASDPQPKSVPEESASDD